MAKSSSDRNTIDLFSKTRGRPKTRPLTRKDQLKTNKRNQRLKEKKQGLKRVEITLESESLEMLDQLCELESIKRADWIIQQIALTHAKPKIKKQLKEAQDSKEASKPTPDKSELIPN